MNSLYKKPTTANSVVMTLPILNIPPEKRLRLMLTGTAGIPAPSPAPAGGIMVPAFRGLFWAIWGPWTEESSGPPTLSCTFIGRFFACF